MKEELYELDKVTGHLFCKYCGNNYLLKEHKDNCKSIGQSLEFQMFELLTEANSMISYLHHRGYIDYKKHKLLDQNEVTQLIGKTREICKEYAKYNGIPLTS